MDDNERYEEHIMDSNRKRMKELDKIFTIAFYVCAVHFIIRLILDVVSIGVALITLGIVADSPLVLILRLFENIVILGVFLWSYFKDRTGTIASMAAVVLWILIGVLIGGTDIIDFVLAALWIGLQALCLSKYKELEYLKAQPGYPTFNAIFLHRKDNRRVAEEQIKESLAENRAPKSYSAQETYQIPEDAVMNDDGSGFMEILSVDGSTLADKNADRFENHYMDDITSDDISASGQDKGQ